MVFPESLEPIIRIIINYKWTILFYLGIITFIILYRKRFEMQGIIALYRTKLGISLMDRWGKRYRELIKLLGLCSIGIAYLTLIFSFILIFQSVYLMAKEPLEVDGSPLVLPGVPIMGTGGIVFPLVAGIITLFIIIIVHEFSHGVVARAHDVKIKSSGIVFIGPLIGAFVEPDEKKLTEKNDVATYSVLAAGPVSNLVLALIVFALWAFVAVPLTIAISQPAGIIVESEPGFPAEAAGIHDQVIITHINDKQVGDITAALAELKGLKPNETVILSNQETYFNITATAHHKNESQGYLGIMLGNKLEPRWDNLPGSAAYVSMHWLSKQFGLLHWVWFISLLVGILNVFPIFITDGARMLQITTQKLIPSKETAKKVWVLINKICLIALLFLVFYPFIFPLIRRILML